MINFWYHIFRCDARYKFMPKEMYVLKFDSFINFLMLYHWWLLYFFTKSYFTNSLAYVISWGNIKNILLVVFVYSAVSEIYRKMLLTSSILSGFYDGTWLLTLEGKVLEFIYSFVKKNMFFIGDSNSRLEQ